MVEGISIKLATNIKYNLKWYEIFY
jgi:hypothetical protein